MFDLSDTRDQWAVHACDAKITGKQVFYLEQAYDGESAIVLDWLLYHDVMSKFSSQLWIQRTTGHEECAQDDQIRKRALLLPRRSKVYYLSL